MFFFVVTSGEILLTICSQAINSSRKRKILNGKVDYIEFLYVFIYMMRKCLKSVFIVLAGVCAVVTIVSL